MRLRRIHLLAPIGTQLFPRAETREVSNALCPEGAAY